MKTIPAGEFKTHCLRIMDEVNQHRQPVMITKKGVPVAKLVPVLMDEELTARERRRRSALEWLKSRPQNGGTLDDWTRDELYHRDAEREETAGCV